MKKALVFLLTLQFTIGCATNSTGFQKDADVVRLNHLEYYGQLLSEYFDKTGSYPFQGKHKEPLYVHIAHDRQLKYTKPGPPYKHHVVSFKDFIQEVEQVLGKLVLEYYDPQFVPDYKPNFYIYMVVNDTFYFAVHVNQEFPFSKKIGKHYHKVEISNRLSDQNIAIKPNVLFASQDFQRAKTVDIVKPDFFRSREIDYLRYTKEN